MRLSLSSVDSVTSFYHQRIQMGMALLLVLQTLLLYVPSFGWNFLFSD